MYGTYVTVDGRPALRFERRLRYPVEDVWRAITETGELAHWFPARIAPDLRVGGRVSFVGDNASGQPEGVVTEVDEPRRFAFRWGADDLRFELEPEDGGAACRLRFTHVLAQRDMGAMVAAGWHVCLDLLVRRVDGEDTRAPSAEPTPEWRAHYDAYVERGVPAGAAVPGES